MNIKLFRHFIIAWQYRADPAGERYVMEMLWNLLLVLGTATFLVAIVFGTLAFFVTPQTTSSAVTGTPALNDILDKEVLTKTLEQFDQRAVRYSFLKSNPPAITVPR